ncbi:MAG: hypothetical protein Q7J78_06505 [Clostridiales bacterium]|nr:hypothetical protein [Clostridiales bacterium]
MNRLPRYTMIATAKEKKIATTSKGIHAPVPALLAIVFGSSTMLKAENVIKIIKNSWRFDTCVSKDNSIS